MSSRLFPVLVFLSALLPAHCLSAPADKSVCDGLSQELQNLKALDVEKLMEKGPEWAVSHLSQGDLALVRRYIEVDEQIKFRCLPPSALVHLHGPDQDEAEEGQEVPVKNAKETTTAAAKGGSNAERRTKEAQSDPAAPAKRHAPKPVKKAVKPVEAHIGLNPSNQGGR